MVVLVIAGGIMAWRDHKLSERRAQSARYASALSLAGEGKDADAAKVFAEVAREGGGYAILASFEEAERLAKSGDREGAPAAYDRIVADGGHLRERHGEQRPHDDEDEQRNGADEFAQARRHGRDLFRHAEAAAITALEGCGRAPTEIGLSHFSRF